MSEVAACELAHGEAVSADCLRERAVNDVLLGEVTRFVGTQGEEVFGERFRMVNRMTWSSGGTGFNGDIDAVFPVSFTAAREPSVEGGLRDSRAVFVQWGVTRWSDEEGTDHNDVRIGAVGRYAVSEEPGADVVGVSALYQQGVESGHGRLVTGVDYAGAWGSGWLHHYLPATGWRPGRSRYEERALEGMELGLRIEPTSTIALDTALTRWESKDGSGRWTTGTRVGLSWRPHPWLSFRAGWEDIGVGEETASIRLTLAIPFGGAGQAVPRWAGLGIAGGGSGAQGDAADIWRPIENVGRLHVAERALPVVPAIDEAADSAPRFTRAVTAQPYTLGAPIRTLWLPPATGGNRPLTYTLTPAVPGLTFAPRALRLTGTPTRAGTYRMIYRVTDADGNVRATDADTRRFTITVQADSAPRFTRAVAPRTYTAGTAIPALVLPAATGGDGALTYRLTPAVPGLRFNAQARSLTGTPTRAGTYRMTYRVTDADGNTRATDADTRRFTITVQADTAPRFPRAVAPRTYTAGSAIPALVLPAATGGNGALTYRLTPAVPGLRFNARTRSVTGTPTRAGTYRMTYRVTDADGNTRATDADTRRFTITVQADTPPRFTRAVAAQTYTLGAAIRTLGLPPARGGNGALTYRLTPSVPGLTFNARMRRLTGTPTRAGAYRMTYSVTDADGNRRATDADRRIFTITVQADTAPRLTRAVAAQTYTLGAAIRTLWLPPARGGNGALTYRLTPAVPGLTFNARARRLTGTPARAGTYRMTYRVTDADRNTRASDADTRTFTITVQADTAPRFTRAVAAQTYALGAAIRTLWLPPARGGNGALTYRLTPAVPGLRFNARARSLTGTPTRAGTYRMTYRVTDADRNTRATDADTRTFTITVQADTAPRFTRAVAAQTYALGAAIRTLWLPPARGGNGALTYRLTPAVPGLTFNARARSLTGTPTRAGTYRMTYRVTDADRNTRASDADTRTFTITVQADTAPRFTRAVAAQTYALGAAMRTLWLPPARGGNGALTYRLTPAVPGLTFNARARSLTGTPTRAGTYRMTYRVTDADRNTRATDADTRTFTITVQADSAPRFSAAVPHQTYTVGLAIRSLWLPAARGGNGMLTYDLTPAVPGLTFNARQRRLSGTPTRAGTYRMTYRVTDADRNTRATDADARTFTITVEADTFPPVVAPRNPPQAAGHELRNVEIAGDGTTERLLVRNGKPTTVTYARGTWIEPKDGSYQRMIVTRTIAVPGGTVAEIPTACMQKSKSVPERGIRFFSQARVSIGAVQTCQRRCLGRRGVQECVWSCENRAPSTRGSIPPQTLAAGSSEAIDVSPYFFDPDDEALTFTTQSSNPGVVGSSISGSTVTLRALAAGTATITVSATDPGGRSVSLNFTVRVDADDFPSAVPPRNPPQASGSDRPNVEVAGADSTGYVLARNRSAGPVTYPRGSWFEPRDGGYQRMIVSETVTVPAGQVAQVPAACMQFSKDVPASGIRFFSQSKPATGTVQSCQSRCLSSGGNLQRCVWGCEQATGAGAACLFQEHGVRICVEFADASQDDSDVVEACREYGGMVRSSCPSGASGSVSCRYPEDSEATVFYWYDVPPEAIAPIADGLRQGCRQEGGRPS